MILLSDDLFIDRMLLEGIVRVGPLALLISFALQCREYCLQIEYICLFSLCLTYIHILRYLYLPTLLYLFFASLVLYVFVGLHWGPVTYSLL